ncbi:hypothetical protein ACLOJK_008527 [Asimina triloba]
MAGTVGTMVKNSEGVHIEYIAIFLAVLFPGALVAFNYELLRNLPHLAALRVYCAGIWHNAVCCGICGLALFLMPLLLYPVYRHGEYPMVLSVSSESPLSESLSYGDLIISLDGISIHDPQEWTEKMASIDFQAQQESDSMKDTQSMKSISGGKGYCVPNYWIDESKKIEPEDEWVTCPGDLKPFRSSPLLYDQNSHSNDLNLTGHMYCLLAEDVVKLKKCSDRWQTSATNRSSCPCLKFDCLDKPTLIDRLEQDETCLSPVEKPGLRWVEITYSSPYSPECSHFRRTLSEDFENNKSSSDNCGGTFVFVGDVLSEAHSVQLTPYWPRWRSKFGLHFPHLLEKSLAYTYHVSATLALLNSLPVFFLDGESIMEVLLCYVTRLNPRRQRKYLRVCLMGGTLLSMFAFSQLFISIIMRYI